MKRTTIFLLLSLLVAKSFATDPLPMTGPAVVNGISYHVDYYNRTACVIAPINFNLQRIEYEGDIVIPETIRFMAENETVGFDYVVTEIAPDAFDNSITTSVNIPGTIDVIPNSTLAFDI